MSDEGGMKRRLMLDDGDDRRLNAMLEAIAKWVNTPDLKPAENQAIADKITSQLDVFENSRRRSQLLHKTNKKEIQKFEKLRTEYEKKVTDIKGQIGKQKLELEKVLVKQDRPQFDLLTKNIDQKPSRMETTRQLVALQEEITALDDMKKKPDQKIGKDKEQFHVPSASANMLRTNIAEDKENMDIEDFNNLCLDDITSSAGSEPTTE